MRISLILTLLALTTTLALPADAGQSVPGHQTTFDVIVEGAGDMVVEKGRTIVVHATGVVMETGQKFWSTRDPGKEAFKYQAGMGKVIPGWDAGCLGMKVGEVRRLIIPAGEAYGEQGFSAWGIPPGATLRFTIKVLTID